MSFSPVSLEWINAESRVMSHEAALLHSSSTLSAVFASHLTQGLKTFKSVPVACALLFRLNSIDISPRDHQGGQIVITRSLRRTIHLQLPPLSSLLQRNDELMLRLLPARQPQASPTGGPSTIRSNSSKRNANRLGVNEASHPSLSSIQFVL